MRQHVNPLSQTFQLPLQLPDLNSLFYDPYKPIHLDIGSARGKFLLELSAQQTSFNYLGLEIRKKLAEAADNDARKSDFGNVRFIFCNVNVSLENWLKKLPQNQLFRVSIQFPDPWFKRRHHKRRVLQPSLLKSIAAALQPSGELFFQSDILEAIKPMAKLVEISQCFDKPEKESISWMNNNPLAITTEREKYVIEQGLPVYRRLYIRNREIVPELRELIKRYEQFNEKII